MFSSIVNICMYVAVRMYEGVCVPLDSELMYVWCGACLILSDMFRSPLNSSVTDNLPCTCGFFTLLCLLCIVLVDMVLLCSICMYGAVVI